MKPFFPYPGKLALFLGLSAADFVLTKRLLGAAESPAYEANPLAAWWLGEFGWAGLAAFKAATVLVVAAAVAGLARQRPRAASRLLGGACLVLGGVLVYSTALGHYAARPDAVDRDEAAVIEQEERRLDDVRDRVAARRVVLDQLARDWVAGRCTLAEATARLAASERGRDADWRTSLRALHPSLSEEGRLARSLCDFTASQFRGRPPEERSVLTWRLRWELRQFLGQGTPPTRLADADDTGSFSPYPLS